VFEQFLQGETLGNCYEAVASVANQWLDVLDETGENMDDAELLELISEKKTISKTLDDYEGRKATSLTTAGRLADFLGAEMVKDKGLNCKLIISKYPLGAPTTERAIPVAIFSADITTRKYYLRKWLKAPSLQCEDFREVVDWEYYKDRLGKSIQKIITIPAGMQGVNNPVPRIEHPSWLQKRLNELSSGLKQRSITSMFGLKTMKPLASILRPSDKVITLKSPLKHLKSNPTSGIEHDVETPSKKRLMFSDVDDSEVVDNLVNDGDIIVSNMVDETPKVLTVEKVAEAILNPEEDLQSWLKDRQIRWATIRKDRKNAAKLAGRYKWGDDKLIPGAIKKPLALSDFVRNAALATTYGYWQIIEFQQMDTPGEFVVWAITSQQNMQKFRLLVPRIMYVNCVGASAENTAIALGGVKVVRDLPHGRQCHSLYEVKVPEVE